MLRDKKWEVGYTNDDGSLADRFYVPALTEAVRYDRGTGYFNMESLSNNMRGIKGLVSNGGKMRLLVGCTLNDEEVEAIRRGEELRDLVEKNLCRIPLDPPNPDVASALELLSWMIASVHLTVKVAVTCDDNGNPVGGSSIFHEKVGVVEDRVGDKISWKGSDNETPSGQVTNWESLMVFASWEEPVRQHWAESIFEDAWHGRNRRLLIMDVPEAVHRKLMQHAPPGGHLPRRLKDPHKPPSPEHLDAWSFISQSYGLKNGEMVGLKTAPIEPWTHQVQVFRRLYSRRPARLLIADEVGLGKTIQAGLFLRQAWLERRRRILVMAPAALTAQWQVELREKLNLDWPVYDGKRLTWQCTHARESGKMEALDDWTAHGPVIVSTQLARRDERARDVVAAEWDVVVLDEAHYARQQEPSNSDKNTPNKTLKLMRALRSKTEDLILLTATPMQVHPVELYDLLSLLGVPREWNWKGFEEFYERLDGLGNNDRRFMCDMFRASEEEYGQIDASKLGVDELWSGNALEALRGNSGIRLHSEDYEIMKNALRLCSPVTRLVSRNTRKKLREYAGAKNLTLSLGTRSVDDKFVEMSADERRVYDSVRRYISKNLECAQGGQSPSRRVRHYHILEAPYEQLCRTERDARGSSETDRRKGQLATAIHRRI